MIYDTCMIVGKHVYIASDEGAIIYIGSPEEGFDHLLKDLKIQEGDIVKGYMSWFQQEIKDYERGVLTSFKSSFKFLGGTPFQQSVWYALSTIPYGKIITYSDVAAMIGKPKAIRAVASAIGNNPIMVMVPCHRVNGKDGSLRGFRGGLDVKVSLQTIEGSFRG